MDAIGTSKMICQAVRRPALFTKEKWEQGKQLFDDLLSIIEADDEDEDGDFDLSNMNLVDIQSVVR